jgi:hypothetical protein
LSKLTFAIIYEIGVEEVEHQWADRVLEHLNNAGDKQRVVK